MYASPGQTVSHSPLLGRAAMTPGLVRPHVGRRHATGESPLDSRRGLVACCLVAKQVLNTRRASKLLRRQSGKGLSMQDCGILLQTPAHEDVSTVSDVYDVLVCNQHLRLSMQSLQKVANFDGVNEELLTAMSHANTRMLGQEGMTSKFSGEVAAMNDIWNSLRASLFLAPVSKEVLIGLLSLEPLKKQLEESEKSLDFDVERVASDFKSIVRTYSNSYGLRAEKEELDKKVEEVNKLKAHRDQLAKDHCKLQEKQISEAGENLKSVKFLNYMIFKEGEENKQGELLGLLRKAWREVEKSNASVRGWSWLGDVVTFGLCQFTGQRNKAAEQAQRDYENFKETFEQKYGDVHSMAFQKEKADLEGKIKSGKATMQKLSGELSLVEADFNAAKDDVENARREFAVMKSNLRRKLEEVGATNVDHFEQIVDATILFNHQQSKHGAFQKFVLKSIKSIKAYEVFIKALASCPWEEQRQVVGAIMGSEAGWSMLAPALGYAQKHIGSLGGLLCSNAVSPDSIPKMSELLPPATKMLSEHVSSQRLPSQENMGINVSDVEDISPAGIPI